MGKICSISGGKYKMKEFATEIIIALISGFISSAITFCITKTYLGFKNFRGLKNMVRLNKDCFSSGIINVFQNRKAYAQHKDQGTSIEYLLKAEHSVAYVGCWLASATEMGDYKKAIKKLTEEKITVTLVLLNPYNNNSLDICSNAPLFAALLGFAKTPEKLVITPFSRNPASRPGFAIFTFSARLLENC